eukprot:4175891-Amphidinium_carterae.1
MFHSFFRPQSARIFKNFHISHEYVTVSAESVNMSKLERGQLLLLAREGTCCNGTSVCKVWMVLMRVRPRYPQGAATAKVGVRSAERRDVFVSQCALADRRQPPTRVVTPEPHRTTQNPNN